MRKLGLSLLVTSMVMVPYAALSQESGAPTPDDYVCALTGDCGEEAAEEAADPAATPEGEPRVSATRGFSLSRPNATRPAPKQTTTRPNRRQTASRPTNTRPNRPVQPTGRVDLRLAFGTGSAALSSAAQAQVRAFAEALKRPQLSGVRIRIEGHTDSSGGRALNQRLSRERAEAVADYLVSQGVERTRLEVEGFAYDRPLPGKRSSDPDNRRVEAVRVS